MSKTNLEQIEVGDKLALPIYDKSWGGYKVPSHRIFTVTKVTDKQLVCGSTRFWKANGREVKKDCFGKAIPLTPEIELSVKRCERIEKVQRTIDEINCGRKMHTDEYWLKLGEFLDAFAAEIQKEDINGN